MSAARIAQHADAYDDTPTVTSAYPLVASAVDGDIASTAG
jgi:hypothetical protein